MKLLKFLFSIAFLFAINNVSAQTLALKWSELNSYQQLLDKTFVPASEGNFSPIKNAYEYLIEKAEALDVKALPEELKNPKAFELVAVLKRQTKLVGELAKNNASNVEIMKSFQKLNQTYDRLIEIYEPKK